MPRRRSGVTTGRLRKVGAEIDIDVDDALAGVAALMTKLTGSQNGRQALGKDLKRRVIMPAALIAVGEIKDLAPVKTGKLKSAVFADYGDPKRPSVLVGMNYKKAPHAHLVEYGTVKTQAHPYFRPGITAARSAMAASMARDMKDFITEEV